MVLLAAGSEQADKDLLGVRPARGPIAAPYLASSARNRLTHPAGRHCQPEGLLEHRRGLAIGQSQALVQLRGQRHRARPQLRRGGAAGVRSLAGMTTLQGPPALPALRAGDLFGVGFLRHVPAYSSAASKQGQSGKRFHHAKQIRQWLLADRPGFCLSRLAAPFIRTMTYG